MMRAAKQHAGKVPLVYDTVNMPLEGERDLDELVTAAVEAIEGDVTDYDICMDFIQTMQEVFDHVIFQ